MKTRTLHTVALALALGFATAASAGDFDFGHPEQDLLTIDRSVPAPATPEQASAQRVAAMAATLKRDAWGGVSTEASRAMLGEDDGPARVGGEEFVVLLPDTGSHGAGQVAAVQAA